MFCIRYVDDTLALIKESDIDNVLSKPNRFHPSLNFTADKFDDGVLHYLDLKIIDNESDIYYKDVYLVNTCAFPVTHPGIPKQLGLKLCIIELRKYVVIRNYWIIK